MNDFPERMDRLPNWRQLPWQRWLEAEQRRHEVGSEEKER